MKGESLRRDQPSFMIQGLKEMCNPRDPLYQLADMIPWDQVETWFEDKYAINGRPAKPVRLMVSLLLLNRLYNLGDETVVEAWVHNPYMQYFSGETEFQWDPSPPVASLKAPDPTRRPLFSRAPPPRSERWALSCCVSQYGHRIDGIGAALLTRLLQISSRSI